MRGKLDQLKTVPIVLREDLMLKVTLCNVPALLLVRGSLFKPSYFWRRAPRQIESGGGSVSTP